MVTERDGEYEYDVYDIATLGLDDDFVRGGEGVNKPGVPAGTGNETPGRVVIAVLGGMSYF